MYPSPLILDRHFFTKVEVESHIDGHADSLNVLDCEIGLGIAHDKTKLYQLILKLKIKSPPEKKAHYTGEIHAVGIFRVADNISDEKASEIVEAYGASVLFAAIRELLLNITSRGPWPSVLLSTFSFVKPKDSPPAIEQNVSSSEKTHA